MRSHERTTFGRAQDDPRSSASDLPMPPRRCMTGQALMKAAYLHLDANRKSISQGIISDPSQRQSPGLVPLQGLHGSRGP